MSVTVISPPLEVRACYARGLKPGDVMVIGESESRCKVSKVREDADGISVTYSVAGLTPVQSVTRTYDAGRLLSLEV